MTSALGKISAIIITKNEERNIAVCLESIKWVDEIVVVDAGSTDDTPDICRSYGALLQVTEWSGFGMQKNKALNLARSEWVLSIDADEVVSKELRDEILCVIERHNKQRKENDDNECIAYKIPRQNYFHNKLIRCLSNKNDQIIRLFKKRSGEFSDDVVHERVIAYGRVGALRHHLVHFSFTDLEELLDKANRYSTLGVQKMVVKNVHPGIAKALVHAWLAFIKIYFIKLGFLDGWLGFVIAFASFEGTFYRYAKLLEFQEFQR